MKLPRLPSCLLGFLVSSFTVSAFAAEPTLKDAFAGKFLVGAAINERMTRSDHKVHALLTRQFNSISPTNLMKWERYNPEPGVYREEALQDYLDFGGANKLYVVGHCLFWHQQTPKWVFENPLTGQTVAKDDLLQTMGERVRHLGQKVGARVDAWDVVNEAIEDDGSLRESPFTKILGKEFVLEAFKMAQEEFPQSVQLLYNDYNLEIPAKTKAVVALVQELRAKGARVDGVGNQAHWRLETPTIAEIETSLLAFKAAGLKVHYTELDIEVLPRNAAGADIMTREAATAENNPYPKGLPKEMQAKLAQRYADIFALFVKHADAIERVTFWGVTDADSWLNNWPVRGRTNYPLLFDRDAKPKPAFEAVLKVAR
jgi:endo-1,4-beta-xylanase